MSHLANSLRPALVALALIACACKADASPTAPGSDDAGEADDACGPQADGSRRFRVLHLNDVYRIEGLADGRGGLDRVRTLREQLEAECGAVLVTHAGDALYPSLLSREYAGAQMIEILNALDGAPGAFDPNLVMTFGNHEFDAGERTDAPGLAARIDQSEFTWLDTTITWAAGDDGQALIGGEQLRPRALVELGGVRVGMFSLMTDVAVPAYVDAIATDYVAVARREVAALREAGAEVVIALTHLAARDDQAVLDGLSGADGPDLILGGHDHVLMTLDGDGRHAYKGDADATRVRVVEVSVDAEGAVAVAADPEGTALGPETPVGDPELGALIDARLAAFDRAFCGADELGCLTQELTVTRTDLLAEELEIRRYESNYADWILDRMVETFAEDGAEIALLNSGSLRLNQNIAAGTSLTRQIVEETFAYPVVMRLTELDGATIQAMLERSVEDWSGGGHWLQVAGLAYRHDVDAGSARDAVVLGAEGPLALDPAHRYRVVLTDFLLDPSGNQDGYTMLSPELVIEAEANGSHLEDVVRTALAAAGDAGIAPEVEGRICSSDRPEQPCLLD